MDIFVVWCELKTVMARAGVESSDKEKEAVKGEFDYLEVEILGLWQVVGE